MNNQFATQFLREDLENPLDLAVTLHHMGLTKDSITMLIRAVEAGHLSRKKAIEIANSTTSKQIRNKPVAEMSSTGGGVTNGATFTPGNGEQYAAGTRKKYQEDAPMLAGGKKADIHTYTQDGFTKAENAKEAGKYIKGVEVKDLWEESRQYSQFKRETATRNKPDQMHEAAKIIQSKLHEIEKLLEFTSQMRNELSEGEQTLEYKHNTKKIFEKIHSKVVEVYTKVKSLK